MRRAIIAIVLLASCTAARASCSNAWLTDNQINEASRAFIFRVLETRIIDSPIESKGFEVVEGVIRITEQLRGVSSFKTIRFTTKGDCALAIFPGHYYFSATSESGESFSPSAVTTVPLGDAYFEWVELDPLQRRKSPYIAELRAAVKNGTGLPPMLRYAADQEYSSLYLHGPVPAPPQECGK